VENTQSDTFTITFQYGINGYFGSYDAYIDSVNPLLNFGQNSGNYLHLRQTNNPKSPVIYFGDIQEIYGKTIVDAYLEMYLNTQAGTDQQSKIARIDIASGDTNLWIDGPGTGTGELDKDGVTYTKRRGRTATSDSIGWRGVNFLDTNAAGDSNFYFMDTDSTVVTASDVNTWVKWDLKKEIEWISDSAGTYDRNYGFVIIASSGDNNNTFLSNEDSPPSLHPKLTVKYIFQAGSGNPNSGNARQMYYGGSGNDFIIKNFPGSKFSPDPDRNEFMFRFSKDETSDGLGHIKNMYFGSSNLNRDTTSAKDGGPTVSQQTFHTLLAQFPGPVTKSSNKTADVSIPGGGNLTLTMIDTSRARAQFRYGPKVMKNGTDTIEFFHIYTVYPNGTIFIRDSIDKGGNLDTLQLSYVMGYDSEGSEYTNTTGSLKRRRGGLYSTDGDLKDFGNGILGYQETGTEDSIFANMAVKTSASDYKGVEYHTTNSATLFDVNTLELMTYSDFSRVRMNNTVLIDSLVSSKQNPLTPVFPVIDWAGEAYGSLNLSTASDVDGDGYNEAEGAYMMNMKDSSMAWFEMQATAGDTFGYDPVFIFTGYKYNFRPIYVSIGVDSFLVENVDYNYHVDKVRNWLIMQFFRRVNAVKDTFIISANVKLRVTGTEFWAQSYRRRIKLHWSTESEYENRGFWVERRVLLDSTIKIDSTLGKRFDSLSTEWTQVNTRIVRGYPTGTTGDAQKYLYQDMKGLINGVVYEYRLFDENFRGGRLIRGRLIIIPGQRLPRVYALHQNYPNPFNPITIIKYDIPKRSKVELNIYNIKGQLVRNLVRGVKEPEYYKVRWKGRDNKGRPVASGFYIYQLKAAKFVKRKKMMVIK